MKHLAFAATILAVLMSGSASQAAPVYHIAKSVALGLPDKWDFVHLDQKGGRVYVAHGTEVTVVDIESGTVVGHVTDIAGAHDVAIADGHGYADNGKTGKVTVFDLSAFKPLGQIDADADSDAMLYEPKSGLLVIANGDAHSASLIDVKSGKRIANVALPGSPEMMAAGNDGKIFINIASANEIVRLDLATSKIDAEWKTPSCEAPHGLAIDRQTGRLFASCHNAKMIVVDATNGKVVAELPIGLGTDSAVFDSHRKLAFSANKDGTLSVIKEKDANTFMSLGDVKTAPGARTMAEDEETGRIFLVTADTTSAPNARENRIRFKPGTAKLLILEPAKSTR